MTTCASFPHLSQNLFLFLFFFFFFSPFKIGQSEAVPKHSTPSLPLPRVLFLPLSPSSHFPLSLSLLPRAFHGLTTFATIIALTTTSPSRGGSQAVDDLIARVSTRDEPVSRPRASFNVTPSVAFNFIFWHYLTSFHGGSDAI